MPTDYHTFATELAQKAGEIIVENFSLGMKMEWKSDGSPLTATDKAINAMVISAVQATYPTYSVLAEEGSALKENSEYTWICDPIDGTVPFAHSIPISTFSLSLLQNGQGIFGLAFDPFMDRLFMAEKGKGAFLNNKSIHVSQAVDLNSATIDLAGIKTARFDMNKLRSPKVQSRVHFLGLKSSTYASMLVATGELTAEIYASKYPWDAATAKIIVEEAGGKVTDIYGNDQRYDQEINGFIASNGIVHQQLVDLVQSSLL